MIGLTVKVRGDTDIPELKVVEVIQKVAKPFLQKLRRMASERTPVDTGTLKAGWGMVEEVSGGLSFDNPVPYAHVVEFGLYKSLGPRTVSEAGKIYSSQAPGGMLSPILEKTDFIDQMAEAIADRILSELSK